MEVNLIYVFLETTTYCANLQVEIFFLNFDLDLTLLFLEMKSFSVDSTLNKLKFSPKGIKSLSYL